MKPPKTFEEQTECIVESLLEEFLDTTILMTVSFVLGEPSSFDVTIIAARLQMLGDQINAEMEESVEKVMKEVATGQVSNLESSH
uniref:Uncharacterized protein n=1 Tax=Monodelphis domestica TaxID=13616 RepID=A0A5F8HFL1_MONDO